MEKIKLTIDDKELETQENKTILEAALDNGIYIPHICHHPDLKPVGTCGLCVVEIEGEAEPSVSCTTPVAAGMVVSTQTPQIEQMRRLALEALLVNHPPECTECSQYLNCELQSLKQFIGVTDELTQKRDFHPFPADSGNPLFVHDLMRCIKCSRCVRACNDLRGAGVLQIIGEGEDARIGIADNRSLAEAGCLFCGACVEVCPTGAMRDQEELMQGKKRRQALVPCTYTCPAQIDVPRYVRLIRQKRYAAAAAVIREKAPFPKVLGYVCHHPCEAVCRRAQVNEAVCIRNLKRFAAENNRDRLWEKSRPKEASGKRVAVIGAGPAGLTAAYYLARQGHAVTVFEALPLAGGMLRYGIPEYRLPRDVLDSEIREIQKAGVQIKTGIKIESLEALMSDDGYQAVLVAIGAHMGKKLPIPGADCKGVVLGLEMLRDLNLGKPVKLKGKVLVLGGGNVAFDCARVARRLGADEVRIACLEEGERIPAAADEIAQGEEEGISLHPGRTFIRILDANGKITAVECCNVASCEFNEAGIPEIDVVEGSEHLLPADIVIFAIGQAPEIQEAFDLETDDRGLIALDPYTFDTSMEGVFAAGDAVSGTASVIEAIASGRKGAAAVDRYLGGSGDIDVTLVPPEAPETWLGPCSGFAARSRPEESCLAPGDRIKSFCEIVRPLDEAEALAESARCLQCDLRLRITPVKFWGEY